MATPTPNKPKKPAGNSSPVWKNKKVLVIAVVATLALAGGATFALWPKNYDAKLQTLAAQGPEALRKAVDNGEIPREVAWEAMGQAREAEMQKRMDAYFALKAGNERNKYLDKSIDEMLAQQKQWDARRKEWEARAATQPSGDRGNRDRRGDGPSSQPSEARRAEAEKRRAERNDKQPPERRAQRAEFMVAMRKRMQERGIQAPQGGRGFGGGAGGFGGGPGGPRGGGGGGGR